MAKPSDRVGCLWMLLGYLAVCVVLLVILDGAAKIVLGVALVFGLVLAYAYWLTARNVWKSFRPPPGVTFIKGPTTLAQVWPTNPPQTSAERIENVLLGPFGNRHYLAYECVDGDGLREWKLAVALRRPVAYCSFDPNTLDDADNPQAYPVHQRYEIKGNPPQPVLDALAAAPQLKQMEASDAWLISEVSIFKPEDAFEYMATNGPVLDRIATELEAAADRGAAPPPPTAIPGGFAPYPGIPPGLGTTPPGSPSPEPAGPPAELSSTNPAGPTPPPTNRPTNRPAPSGYDPNAYWQGQGYPPPEPPARKPEPR